MVASVSILVEKKKTNLFLLKYFINLLINCVLIKCESLMLQVGGLISNIN